jgi:hypothetical protein
VSRTVWGVDHIYIPLRGAEEAFRSLTDGVKLPTAWPYAAYGDFASGGINFGNVNLEVLAHSDVVPAFSAAEPAQVRGIAFHPVSTPELIAELDRRKLAHSPAQVFPPGTSVGTGAMWTNTWFETVSIGATNVFACEYHLPGAHDYEVRQRALDGAGGGTLGLLGVREIVLESADMVAARERWQRLLDPVPQAVPGYWRFDHGPALRLVAGSRDGVVDLVLNVRSVESAKPALQDLARAMNELPVRLVEGDSGE